MSQNSPTASSVPGLPTADPDRTARLRAALRAAAFTADGCLDLLGATAYAALSRSETVPALRATRGGSPLQTLIRLFLLQRPVTTEQARAALPLDDALADGWLRGADDATVRATVDVRPYAGESGEDWWIVSDLGCAVGGAGGIGAGFSPTLDRSQLVLGVGGASTTLAGITIREPVSRVLDLGTGSGIQALHAGAHASRVTATDVNPRALHFARLTLALSGAREADLRQGTLFEPVSGERFDLIVSNPPFVISPGERFVYRDGGMAGDDLCRTLVQRAADHLTEGGYCQLLANWEHVDGEDWRERVTSWVPSGCDAWIVQREVQDPAQYAELWLRDGGDHRSDPASYAARYDEWLDEFEHRRVKGVGFGWITLRNSGSAMPSVTAEEWPHPVEQPLGPEIRKWFERQDFLRAHDDAALLATCFRLADEVVQEQVGLPGSEDPEHVVLRSNRGMRRATKVDTVGAGFAGVCDGSLSAGRILDAIARLLGEDPVVLRDRTPAAIRLLVEQGFIEPVD
ncbi:methyltransferase [Streptantibioticus rubrisoli]|uniref:Class I SAM-dependent methyltransferase n=1 Tax=Streptantibioticus rubrisoli TaxID=1387313 RepID=A0ABT1PJN7_9ACTN|nr:methyltransferase [Streptantibioticus rubrisoli]MCQ4045577.1 class I SAM-dependent methyltransferase [Streptantibioticus rubrisoli]